MLEVLIAIVVFSFGMIGMLGLVLNGLKITTSSNYRSIAAQQLAAMADALNANPLAIGDYLSAHGSSVTATESCFTTGCSSDELPTTEYKLWQDRIAELLPSGAAVLCQDDTDPSDGTPSDWKCNGKGRPVVKICWNESRLATAWATTCMTTQL